jgi:hypothetical protein
VTPTPASKCPPNYDNRNGLCNTCLNAWSGNNCQTCDPIRFDNTDGTCSNCLNGWYTDYNSPIINPHILCNLCSKFYDNTDGKCSKCKAGFTGPNCITCSPTIPITKLGPPGPNQPVNNTVWVVDFGNQIPPIIGVKAICKQFGSCSLVDKDGDKIFDYVLSTVFQDGIEINNQNATGKYVPVTLLNQRRQLGKIYYIRNVLFYGKYNPYVYASNENSDVKIYPQVCLPEYSHQ